MTALAVAQAAVALRATALPGPVLEAAKLHFLDAIGVGLAASRVPQNMGWASALAQVGGAGQATVLGQSTGAPPAMAVSLLSTISRAPMSATCLSRKAYISGNL